MVVVICWSLAWRARRGGRSLEDRRGSLWMAIFWMRWSIEEGECVGSDDVAGK